MKLIYKSLDTMKASRDHNDWTNQDKIDHCNAIVQNVPDITHITWDGYYANPGYHSAAYIQEWIDAIRATGKKVWFRGVPDWTGLTAAQAITNIAAVIAAHPTWFATGDIFEFAPESHPYAFPNPPDNWNNSTVLWSQWIADMIASCNTAFAAMGKTLTTTIQSTTASYATQGDIKATAIAAMNNQLSIDYYPLEFQDPDLAVESMLSTLTTLHAMFPAVNIIISEMGYPANVSATDEKQRQILQAAFDALSNLSYVIGFNYWVGYNTTGGGNDDICLFQKDSRTIPRPALKTLSDFYTSNTPRRMTTYTEEYNAYPQTVDASYKITATLGGAYIGRAYIGQGKWTKQQTAPKNAYTELYTVGV